MCVYRTFDIINPGSSGSGGGGGGDSSLIEVRQTRRQFRLQKRVFSDAGGLRLVSCLQDVTTGQRLVAKRSNRTDPKSNSFQALLADIECQLTARKFAADYVKALSSAGEARRNFDFLPPGIVDFGGVMYATEPFLVAANDFTKYTNNESFVAGSSGSGGGGGAIDPVLTAFSHWTYAQSEGKLLVCDVQVQS